MRTRSNSSDKAEKQKFEAKTVIIYSSLETGSDLCLQGLSYKKQSTKKLFKKDEAKKH